MAMVDIESGSLQADSAQVVWLGRGSAATWRRSTFIKWSGWTLAMALPWWQHHKHYHTLLLSSHH